MAIHRQTISFLQERFAQVGIRPVSRHGQNFLIDLNLIDVLVREADLQSNDVILEVGTGTGALTGRLAQYGAAVVTVELDPQLFQLAAEELVDLSHVTMLHQDVLRNKNNIRENVIDAVTEQLRNVEDAQFKLVSNLPYSIATPLISNLLLTPIIPVLMVVTIQKELADRITAVPRTKDYGALSVWTQSLCHSEIVRILPPTVFWPRPKVDSAFLRIQPDPVKRAAIRDVEGYHQFVRSLFFHRRKFLRSVLVSGFKNELEKPHIDEIMRRAEMGPETRAEELPAPRILELYHHALDVAAEVKG